jgi:hypothetical protein
MDQLVTQAESFAKELIVAEPSDLGIATAVVGMGFFAGRARSWGCVFSKLGQTSGRSDVRKVVINESLNRQYILSWVHAVARKLFTRGIILYSRPVGVHHD